MKYNKKLLKSFYCTGHGGKLELTQVHLKKKSDLSRGFKCVHCEISGRPYTLKPTTLRKLEHEPDCTTYNIKAENDL